MVIHRHYNEGSKQIIALHTNIAQISVAVAAANLVLMFLVLTTYSGDALNVLLYSKASNLVAQTLFHACSEYL